MTTQFYPLSQVWWPDAGALTVRDETKQLLLTIPIQFLQQADCCTYVYVLEQLQNTFEESGDLWFDGQLVAGEENVSNGLATYVRNDGQQLPCTPRAGPRYKYKYRSPADDESTSTMSNSKRSSANQSRFRDALLARDGACLLSDVLYESCTAAHILPQSRPEYYSEVFGAETRYLFMPSYGLLLRDDLHHSFDKGHFALFPKGDNLVVHVFAVLTPDIRQYHGKVLPPSRFRGPPDRYPSRDLLAFHYQQSAMKYLRGFSSGIGPPAP